LAFCARAEPEIASAAAAARRRDRIGYLRGASGKRRSKVPAASALYCQRCASMRAVSWVGPATTKQGANRFITIKWRESLRLDGERPPRNLRVMSRRQPPFEITAELLLRAYAIGLFPMAEDRDSAELHWVEPERRGVFPLDGLKVSKSLAKTVRSDVYEITANRAFGEVMRACATRERTWINAEILRLYGELHERGHAHSVEARVNGELVGGLYGVTLGGAFFGESMFHRARDASKVALVHLVARLKYGGFRLLDTQFLTEHLASLGAVEISRADYRRRLTAALEVEAEFGRYPPHSAMPGADALDLLRQPA
jgi:leucyl/phenylalanyl-tRNA---protein transferase